ncbi:MAG: hypothetical protein EPN48_18345 [Microbacteriaceae bacterium]|nr:MAG: hypothetical protein EPN48_18345 [Microbacteriaceae bacterium]
MSLRTSAGIAQVCHLSKAFGLSRAALYKAAAKDERPIIVERRERPIRTPISNETLLVQIGELVAAHPAWGHRKVWAMLRRRGVCVARRRVWALMHQAGLTFAPSARRCEPRRGSVAVELPNRRWSTDMTTTWTRKDGWVALTPVIDNGCRTLFEIGVSKAQDAPAITYSMPLTGEKAGSPMKLPESVGGDIWMTCTGPEAMALRLYTTKTPLLFIAANCG